MDFNPTITCRALKNIVIKLQKLEVIYATLAWFLTHCADGLRPFQNFKNRVKEFSIFSTVLVKTSLHKFGEPISHQIFHSPLKYLLLEYCRYRLPVKTAVL